MKADRMVQLEDKFRHFRKKRTVLFIMFKNFFTLRQSGASIGWKDMSGGLTPDANSQ